MNRAEHRRREHAKRKGRLDGDARRLLNAARRLPEDHPSATTATPTYTDPRRAHRYLDVVRRSGVGEELQRWLGAHPGPKSRLNVEALLVAVLLAGEEKKNYLRSDICAVINSFDATLAYTLGLCDEHTRRPVSYHTTQKQLRRLELAVRDGWTSPCGKKRDLAWLTRTLLDATIPRDQRRSITAVALDSTFVETWAVTRDFTPDAVAQHRLAARQIPDLPEPEPLRPDGSGAIGTIGPDGRLIRSADTDARPGYHSATSKRPAGLGLGYDFHVAVAVRGAHWSGDPTRLTLTDLPPAYICALAFVAASTNPGPVGREAIEDTTRHAPNLQEVVADLGYTLKRTNFVRHLRERGLDVVMDYRSTEVARPKAVTAGRHQQPVIDHCGTLLPSWVPEALHTPPEGPTSHNAPTSTTSAAAGATRPTSTCATAQSRCAAPNAPDASTPTPVPATLANDAAAVPCPTSPASPPNTAATGSSPSTAANSPTTRTSPTAQRRGEAASGDETKSKTPTPGYATKEHSSPERAGRSAEFPAPSQRSPKQSSTTSTSAPKPRPQTRTRRQQHRTHHKTPAANLTVTPHQGPPQAARRPSRPTPTPPQPADQHRWPRRARKPTTSTRAAPSDAEGTTN